MLRVLWVRGAWAPSALAMSLISGADGLPGAGAYAAPIPQTGQPWSGAL